MKRDLDLVRSILIYVENAADEVDADDMATERWPIETVAYHVGSWPITGFSTCRGTPGT